MGRTISQIVLLIYLLTIPAGVYVYLSSNGTGYPTKLGSVLVVGLALVGLVMIPVVDPVSFRRGRTDAADKREGQAPDEPR